jgi:glycosyltransferase involved in cell wall biosynthesis
MPDDNWSRGKCGLKLLQYMAAGLPVVANRIGVHKEIVLHGETGFLADTAEEWQNAIGQLATDPALRRRMGAAGRRRLAADYSVERGAAMWRNVLSSLQVGRAAA